MTRFLQAMGGAHHGGAEAFFERLAIALGKTKDTQTVVIRRDAERAARLRTGSIEPIELGFGGALDFLTKPRLKRIIKAEKPQLVLTWMSRATQLCPKGDFVHVARLGGYYDLRHYRNCKHLVGNTRGLVAWMMRQGWPQHRAHYLPNFPDVTPMPPVSRASLDTPEDAPLALAMGRLHPHKSFDVLLDAVSRVPGLYLWLAGDGELGPTLKQQARVLGIADRVRFLGWRQDSAALLGAADMLVSAARVEPLGNTILEAWAASVPVVAAKTSGPAELIENRKTGLLVDVGDAPALATAMKRIADEGNFAADLAQQGHEAFMARFSEKRVVDDYRDFFRKVAG